MGLRLLVVGSRAVSVLTKDYDNLPGWSPMDDRIMFTRGVCGEFDIYTIHADGTGLTQITTTPGNDAHAVWTTRAQAAARTGACSSATCYVLRARPLTASTMWRAEMPYTSSSSSGPPLRGISRTASRCTTIPAGASASLTASPSPPAA